MPLSSHRQFEPRLAHRRRVGRAHHGSPAAQRRGAARRASFEAMRYSSLGGGKRLRAFFVLAGATLFKVGGVSALRTASAIEFVHAYSLIHDDLPAMDDDDLRRGKPSCHKQFDEATAILAGDALQALAFEVLAHEDTHGDPAVRAALVAELARAAGAHGMVGGQMIDLLAESAGGRHVDRRHHAPAAAQDRRADLVLLHGGRDPRQGERADARGAVGLCPRSRPRLPDRRRPARRRGQRRGARQDAGQGRRRPARRPSCRSSARSAPAPRPTCWRDRPAAHLEPFGEAADLLRQAAKFVVARRA